MIRIVSYGSDALRAVLARTQLGYADLNQKVADICESVRAQGDEALFAYTEQFDRVTLTADTVCVSEQEIDAAYASVREEVLRAMRASCANITAYQTRMMDTVRSGEGLKDGTGYLVRPVSRAGIYVPGGKAAYPSSVMMAALTARAAGVKDVVMCTPCGSGINPLTLVAARECGVSKVYRVGGAQAVAAMAYGTQSVPRCDVVTGPGNIFVALAKKYVYGEAGIDMIAGPSEILVVADDSANADWLAADMLSQAEHDELASAFLVTTDEAQARAVQAAIEQRLSTLPKEAIARKSIDEHGAIVLVTDLAQAAEIANAIAPEHMELCVRDPDAILSLVTNAGAVFLGHYSPEPLGDYYAGPNHVLPTSGAARFSSALSVDYFIKKISLIRYTPSQLRAAARDIVLLAETEGLRAHADSIRVRFQEEKL